MLYSMGKGNVLKTKVVESAEEQQEAGSDWKESPPKPRGRPTSSGTETPKPEPEPEAKDSADDDSES